MIRYYNGDYGFPAGNAAAVGGTGQLARNIPVGEDPLLPMDREQFDDWVKYNLDKNKPLRPRDVQPPSTGPQLPGFVKGAFLPGAPGNMGGFQGGVPMGNAAFFPGGQLPQGFIGKTVA